MKESKLLVIPLLIISTFAFSQDLSNNVIAAQGNFDRIENMTLEWTLGELFIETVTTKDKIYSQGFLQPFLITTAKLSTNKLETNPFNIKLYPNPVDALLHVYIKPINRTNLIIKLYDVTGKFIKQATALKTDEDITLNVDYLQSGIYLLKFSNADGTLSETHEIVKY